MACGNDRDMLTIPLIASSFAAVAIMLRGCWQPEGGLNGGYGRTNVADRFA
jgi:hypothetical protein